MVVRSVVVFTRWHLVAVQLLGLQVYTGSFETGWWGEMACHFSQGRHLLELGSVQGCAGRLSMGYGSSMSQSSILPDALSSL
jgi:hypothetical protein